MAINYLAVHLLALPSNEISMALLNEFLNYSPQAFLSSLQTVEALCRDFKSALQSWWQKLLLSTTKMLEFF